MSNRVSIWMLQSHVNLFWERNFPFCPIFLFHFSPLHFKRMMSTSLWGPVKPECCTKVDKQDSAVSPSLLVRRILLVYGGILTQLSKQKEGKNWQWQRLPAVNTAEVHVFVFTAGAYHVSKWQEYDYIFKVFCTCKTAFRCVKSQHKRNYLLICINHKINPPQSPSRLIMGHNQNRRSMFKVFFNAPLDLPPPIKWVCAILETLKYCISTNIFNIISGLGWTREIRSLTTRGSQWAADGAEALGFQTPQTPPDRRSGCELLSADVRLELGANWEQNRSSLTNII